MKQKELAGMMDHTLLKATATPAQIEKLCKEAMEIGSASVCVNPCNIEQCARLLKGSDVKVCTVIGFPLGANTSEAKAFETRDAIAKGAQEVDMVINVGALLAGNTEAVYNDIKAVTEAAAGTTVKVIIETCYLNDEQKKAACEMSLKAGADFVKLFPIGNLGAGYLKAIEAPLSHIKMTAVGGVNEENAAEFLKAGAAGLGVGGNLAKKAWIDAGEYDKLTDAARTLVEIVKNAQ